MKAPTTDQILALSGVFQASVLVKQVARQGMTDLSPLEASIASILKTSADSTADVFGGAGNLQLGLRALKSQLNDVSGRDIEVMGYSVSLISLERKLVRRSDLMARIGEGIEAAKAQADHFSVSHPNVLARLADIYKETISGLAPSIMVRGESVHLTNPSNESKVRALLLSGIRAAVLWRQKGGSKIQLVFRRGRYIAGANALLAEVAEDHRAA